MQYIFAVTSGSPSRTIQAKTQDDITVQDTWQGRSQYKTFYPTHNTDSSVQGLLTHSVHCIFWSFVHYRYTAQNLDFSWKFLDISANCPGHSRLPPGLEYIKMDWYLETLYSSWKTIYNTGYFWKSLSKIGWTLQDYPQD